MGLGKGLDGQGFGQSTPPASSVFITFSLPVGIPQTGSHVALGSVEQSITHTAHSSYINDDVTIWLWELEGQVDNQSSRPFFSHFHGHKLPVTSIAVSNDSNRMASYNSDRTIRIWDVYSGECESILEGHEHYVLDASLFLGAIVIFEFGISRITIKRNNEKLDRIVPLRIVSESEGIEIIIAPILSHSHSVS